MKCLKGVAPCHYLIATSSMSVLHVSMLKADCLKSTQSQLTR